MIHIRLFSLCYMAFYMHQVKTKVKLLVLIYLLLLYSKTLWDILLKDDSAVVSCAVLFSEQTAEFDEVDITNDLNLGKPPKLAIL